ncbi:hypothetical protein G7046_g986 [Stylonectria norvegica]|nr:hypothetical protein G7046_g986 [Stylonectria norvegica]
MDSRILCISELNASSNGPSSSSSISGGCSVSPTFTRRRLPKKFPALRRHGAIINPRPSHPTAAAMLPSRGLVRSLPSGALQRKLYSQSISSSRTLPRTLGNGRCYGTALRTSGAGLMAGSRSTGRYVVSPVVLGGVAAKRNLSLWGYGKKTTTEEPLTDAAATTTTATTTATPQAAVQTTPSVEASAQTTTPVLSQTLPEASATPTDSFVADTPVLPSDLDLASIAELGNANILTLPEDIGFLSAIGLDYGWGFTSIMQWVIEHVHVYTGFGWGGTIVATALLLRAVMFYPQLRSLRFNAAMTLMKADPRGQESLDLIKKGYGTGDREMMQKGQFLSKMVRKEYNASNTGMLWAFVQIPFSFGLFRIISGMVNIPVPSLETAGFLWFPDLTASDPFFVLPAVGSALLFGAMLVNSKYAPAQQKQMMKKMMYVFGTVGFACTTFLSAGVNLMMVSTGTATLLTALLLNNPAIRRAFGLPILQVHEVKYEAPRPVAPGISGLKERLNNNLEDMKKGFNDSVTSYTGKAVGSETDRAEKKRTETLRKLEDMRKQLEREQFDKKYKTGR